MAFNYSPKIVTDGLVFAVDAANRKSYTSGSSTWIDLVGGNNGVLTNGPTFDSGNGGSIVFDGVNDQIYTTSGDVFNIQGPGNITAVFKINNISSKTHTSILSILKPNNGIQIGFRNNGSSFGVFKYGGNFLLDITNQLNFPQQGEITHISINFNNSNITYYKNGIQIQSTTSASNQTGNAPYIISGYTIGNYTENFAGNLYLTSIYNRILTPQEITQNYNALKGRFGL